MKTITAEALNKRLAREEVLLIDVREPAEYRSACIEQAALIPLGEMALAKLSDTSKPIVIHCHSGKRSAAACSKLLAEDPTLAVFSLEGGIEAWQKMGFPVKKSGSTALSLERQTQIAVGCIVFFGTLVGAFVHSAVYVVPGFMGMGLVFAGLTGWCGMAKLLAKMPWNK